MLHLIRNKANAKYNTDRAFKSEDLFKAGDSFELKNYRNQFVRCFKERERRIQEYTDQGITVTSDMLDTIDNNLVSYSTLDFGQKLGWKFEVLSINKKENGRYTAQIKLTKGNY